MIAAGPVDRALRFDPQAREQAEKLPAADTRTWSELHPQLAAAAWIGGAAVLLALAGAAAVLVRRWKKRNISD